MIKLTSQLCGVSISLGELFQDLPGHQNPGMLQLLVKGHSMGMSAVPPSLALQITSRIQSQGQHWKCLLGGITQGWQPEVSLCSLKTQSFYLPRLHQWQVEGADCGSLHVNYFLKMQFSLSQNVLSFPMELSLFFQQLIDYSVTHFFTTSHPGYLRIRFILTKPMR